MSELVSGENPEIKKSVAKHNEAGLDNLKGFCKMHKIKHQGNNVTEIIQAHLKDYIVNEHIEVQLNGEHGEKEYLWKEVKLFKEAKVESIVESCSELENIKDPTEEVVTEDNLVSQLKDLKVANKAIKEQNLDNY